MGLVFLARGASASGALAGRGAPAEGLRPRSPSASPRAISAAKERDSSLRSLWVRLSASSSPWSCWIWPRNASASMSRSVRSSCVRASIELCSMHSARTSKSCSRKDVATCWAFASCCCSCSMPAWSCRISASSMVCVRSRLMVSVPRRTVLAFLSFCSTSMCRFSSVASWAFACTSSARTRLRSAFCSRRAWRSSSSWRI
mmetsp:Transcript_110249/g.322673  ORF Transcript_110249/g.322673 Transcript_110249/m.322673 type:complete len:201 (-) Transcript_110249:523-1125(-)